LHLRPSPFLPRRASPLAPAAAPARSARRLRVLRPPLRALHRSLVAVRRRRTRKSCRVKRGRRASAPACMGCPARAGAISAIIPATATESSHHGDSGGPSTNGAPVASRLNLQCRARQRRQRVARMERSDHHHHWHAHALEYRRPTLSCADDDSREARPCAPDGSRRSRVRQRSGASHFPGEASFRRACVSASLQASR
jgi:hypothetical protein